MISCFLAGHALTGLLIGMPLGAVLTLYALLLYNARHVPTVNDICNAGLANPNA